MPFFLPKVSDNAYVCNVPPTLSKQMGLRTLLVNSSNNFDLAPEKYGFALLLMYVGYWVYNHAWLDLANLTLSL